jgi:indolepyruvate ferredoxin oxidoreductase
MSAFTLDDRYLREDGEVYLTGVQALVRVVLDRLRADHRAGRQTAAFVSGYEGSPLGGLDLELARRGELFKPYQMVHQPGLNEELAATSVMGSQLAARAGLRGDGVTGFWYGKAPGLDRATDALRHANMAGAHPRGGAVALVGDDPNAKSSTVPSASELALADLSIPVLFPADPADIVDFGKHAIELSRASGLWTALKVVANVADAASTVAVSRDWAAPAPLPAKAYCHEPSGRLLGAGLRPLEESLYATRLPLAVDYIRASGLNRLIRGPRDRIGILTAGKSYLDVRQALRILGLNDSSLPGTGIRLLKLGAIWPLEPRIVREFAAGLEEVIVVEEKRAFLEPAVKDVLYGMAGAPPVRGKELFPAAGELDAGLIAAGLRTGLERHAVLPPAAAAPRQLSRGQKTSLPLLARTPYFCSGCPHNSSIRVPAGSMVGGGIGCHALALLMPSEAVGDMIGLTQMGGEGAQWIGMAPFVEVPHMIQNLGDGTYAHSGSLAIRAAVAAGVNITYKILFNSAVAMTGGQQPVGGLPVGVLARRLRDEGAAKVIITSDDPGRLRRMAGMSGADVRHRDELLAVQEELAATGGVTVLIHEQECAAEKRRKRRRGLGRDPGNGAAPPRRVLINERACEGCGDCGAKSNCLSVQPVDTEFGRKTAINQSSCNLDYSCLKGDCPSFITVTPAPPAGRGSPGSRPVPDLPADTLPDPVPAPGGGDFAVRITGIGGTGIVTVSQVLATAAFLDGRQVRTLDQIGLSQKGGAVVSDVKVTAAPTEQSPKLAAGECDLYLACDPLVGADPVNLTVADPGKTIAIVTTAEVPTGAMITDPGVPFPGQDTIRSAIGRAVATAWYLDAPGLSRSLFGDEAFANILQLGAAYQAGAIALTAQSIERAIEANGTAVSANIQAFRRGRQAIAAHAGPERDRGGPPGAASASSGRPAPAPQAAGQRPAPLAVIAPDTGAANSTASHLQARPSEAPPPNGERSAQLAVINSASLAAGGTASHPEARPSEAPPRDAPPQETPSREALPAEAVSPEALSPAALRVWAIVAAEPGSELARVLAVRVPDLIAYADEAYAAGYARFVEHVRAQAPQAPELAVAVARGLHKLMAYKDEYEVARLSLDPALDAAVTAQFGAGARVAYQLHPPLLRALGLDRKISLGSWFRPAFRALHAARRVRGTWLDPFGHTEVRRTERALIAEYRAAIERALVTAPARELATDLATELAALPDMVRGYEHVKMERVARYRQRQAELLEDLARLSPAVRSGGACP